MPTSMKERLERRALTDLQYLCNVCGVPLLSRAEARIGVHIACVQEVNNRPNTRIPRPRYSGR